MPIARDLASSAGRFRAIDKGPTGEILYVSDFAKGFDGWRAVHFTANDPTPPLGLKSYPTNMEARSLYLSTGMRPYAAGNVDNGCQSFRGQSLYTSRRYLAFSGFFAVRVGGFSASWDSWGMYLDIQKTDNSSRSFPRLTVKAASSPDFSKVQVSGGHTLVTDPITYYDIPGSTHLVVGDNENKQGFNYLRLTWDRQANGGLGGYAEAQIQDRVFSLTGLGAGSANEPPQIAVSPDFATIAEFNGGMNIGLFVQRSTNAAVANSFPAGLVAGRLVLSAHD